MSTRVGDSRPRGGWERPVPPRSTSASSHPIDGASCRSAATTSGNAPSSAAILCASGIFEMADELACRPRHGPLLDSPDRRHRFRGAEERRTDELRLFMAEAIAEARRGGGEGEEPIGAVAVIDDAMIARDHDRSALTTTHRPRRAADPPGGRQQARRPAACRRSTIFATHEPCAMCVGALVEAQVRSLVFAIPDLGARRRRKRHPARPQSVSAHQLSVVSGVRESEARGWPPSPHRSEPPGRRRFGSALDSHPPRRGVRVVEGAALEKRCAGNRTVGSNPTLSATSPHRSVRPERSPRGLGRGTGNAVRGNPSWVRIPPSPPPRLTDATHAPTIAAGRARRGTSGALYPQSATAELNSRSRPVPFAHHYRARR